MEPRTKLAFGWSSVVIGCLLIGIPMAVYMNSGFNTLSIGIGILGAVIAINGARYINRADRPTIERKTKKRSKRKR